MKTSTRLKPFAADDVERIAPSVFRYTRAEAGTFTVVDIPVIVVACVKLAIVIDPVLCTESAVWPAVPAGPAGPTAPAMPGTPWMPCGPAGPTAPIAPAGPAGPTM